MQSVDLWLTLFFGMGLFQVSWFSIMLYRRGIPAKNMIQSLPPLVTIWVLAWPIYLQAMSLFAALLLIGSLLLLVFLNVTHPLRVLRSAWSHPDRGLQPLTMLFTSLVIATSLFQISNVTGFATALCVLLAPTVANLMDNWVKRREGWRQCLTLSTSMNPQQTLPGHLVMFTMAAWLTSWAMSVYHQSTVYLELPHTWILAIAVTAARLTLPSQESSSWSLPVMALVMSGMLWL